MNKILKRVLVEAAPGYADFEAWEYDRFEATDSRGELSIVIDYFSNIIVVPAYSVTYLTD